jgi:hypothetical protein
MDWDKDLKFFLRNWEKSILSRIKFTTKSSQNDACEINNSNNIDLFYSKKTLIPKYKKTVLSLQSKSSPSKGQDRKI